MKTNDRAVLVTGANRGIGRALVEEAFNKRRETGVCGNAPALCPLG